MAANLNQLAVAMYAPGSMIESIDILKGILKNKLVNYIVGFPYLPYDIVTTVNYNNIEPNILILHNHIIKTDDKDHKKLINTMAARPYGVRWYNEQIQSMLNMGEAIQKLNNDSKDTMYIITGLGAIMNEMIVRGLWVV